MPDHVDVDDSHIEELHKGGGLKNATLADARDTPIFLKWHWNQRPLASCRITQKWMRLYKGGGFKDATLPTGQILEDITCFNNRILNSPFYLYSKAKYKKMLPG